MPVTYGMPGEPLILAHKGGGAEAPEHSLAAYWHARECGFVYLEADVRVDDTGICYLVHNATSLLPNRPLKLSAKRPTLLTDLFAAFQDEPVCFSLDPKHDRAVEPLAQAIAKFRLQNRVCIGSSFHVRSDAVGNRVEALTGVRPATALVGVSSLVSLLCNAEALKKQKAFLRAEYIHVPVALITENAVRRAHSAGLRVVAWVVNDSESVRRVLATGADGFMTDKPSTVLKAIGV